MLSADGARRHSSHAGPTILDTAPQFDAAGKGPDGVARNGKGPASSSARLKDVVDSYLRQLYGGDTAARVLAAQGLGALPSFLPPPQGPEALRLGVELGVVGSLVDVLTTDDEMTVQEACLMALAALLLATAPYEDHAAPLRPPHLKLLGGAILRPQVVAQIGFLLTATTNSRVVLAAARVVAIMAPYITQANDLYILDSRIVPALLAAAASRPDPAAVTSAVPTPRGAAACVLALLTLAQSTPDLYVAICTAEFLQTVSVLYERCIDPDQTSEVLLPADAAELLLRCAALCPNPRWVLPRLPQGLARSLERNVEESDLLTCLVSYLAVESGNLRRLGEDLAAAAAGNAAAVMDRNGTEIKHLKSEMRERRQQLAEARVAVQGAMRKLEAAEAEADRSQAAAEEADAAVQRGGGVGLRQARREAEAKAEAAAEAAAARRRGVEAAEATVEELLVAVEGLRRAIAPLQWQSDRMARLKTGMEDWRKEYGFKTKSKVKVSRPNLAMLTKVLGFLGSRVRPASRSERGGAAAAANPATNGLTLPGGPPAAAAALLLGPSREHATAVQARLLEAGLVQAMIQLFTVLGGVQSLSAELAAVTGDLALQPDLAAALSSSGAQLRREAEGLGAINRRAELRLRQVYTEAGKLRKALKLDLPLPEGSPRRASVDLGPGNGLSRTVRQEDVQQRLEALETEADDLEAALGDSEALMDFLQDRIGAVDAASTNISESYTIFLKAFPAQAAPTTPAIAPAGATRRDGAASSATHCNGNGHDHTNGHAAAATAAATAAGDGDSANLPYHSSSLRPASRSILAKDPAHPAGHLLGLLSRALAPMTRGSALNLPALVRQLLGRLPDGGGGGAAATAALWPPLPAAGRTQRVSVGGGGGGDSTGRPTSASVAVPGSRSRSVGSAVQAGARPSSAGARTVGVRAPAARPSSARSAGTGPIVERSSFSDFSSDPVSRLLGDRSGAAAVATAATGYTSGGAAGFGGPGGLLGSGPFPTDGKGRPMRYPRESMYGIIQSTFSPMRGYSTPANGPRLALLLREKSLPRRSTGGGCGAGPRGSDSGFTNPRASVGLMADDSVTATAELTASVVMPLTEESRRVIHQVVSSVLFDPIDADVLGPGVVCQSAGPSLTLADGLSNRPLTAYGSRAATGQGVPAEEEAVLPQAAAAAAVASAGGGGGGMSVLDALLMQSELLCGVMESLATLQQFSKSTIRTCRQLPASLSYASLHPGALGPYMARLHGMWAGAIARHPEMRVLVAECVTEIAQMALVPGSEFEAVYRATGMVEVLVQMLGSGLRPAKTGGSDEAPVVSVSDRKSRHVGRLTLTAPPTLRVGPGQQAEQAAAGQALRAISQAQDEVLAAIGQDAQLLRRLSSLVLDHSMSWAARQAAVDLLSDLVLGGGPGAEAAVASGAYAGMVEMLSRYVSPLVNNQDPRGGKETVVSALACMVAHPELLGGVVTAAKGSQGPSAGLPLNSPEQVMGAILRNLWSVVWHVHSTYISDRKGRFRYVDPELISALTATAATAARELAVLADTVADARRVMNTDMGLRRKINSSFLQVIKDATLYEAIIELRKNLS